MENSSRNDHMSESEDRKIKLDFSEVALAKLDKMCAQAGNVTRGALACNALRGYRWFLGVQRDGTKILLDRGDDDIAEVVYEPLQTMTNSERASERSIVPIQFSEEAFADYKEIKRAAGLSNAELFREALRFYEWYLDLRDANVQLLLQKENGDTVAVELLF